LAHGLLYLAVRKRKEGTKMNKRYPVYIIAIMILVLSFGIMVKRAVSDVVVSSMRADFCQALREGNVNNMLKFVETENPQALSLGVSRLSTEERERWASIFEKGKLVDQTPMQRTYQTYGMFDGTSVLMEYSIRLHQDGQWKIETGSSLAYLP
jgi:hypothetical protein